MAQITVREFAEQIGKTPPRVRQMIADGEIKAIKLGRDWIIDTKEVEKAKKRPRQRNRAKGTTKKAA